MGFLCNVTRNCLWMEQQHLHGFAGVASRCCWCFRFPSQQAVLVLENGCVRSSGGDCDVFLCVRFPCWTIRVRSAGQHVRYEFPSCVGYGVDRKHCIWFLLFEVSPNLPRTLVITLTIIQRLRCNLSVVSKASHWVF